MTTAKDIQIDFIKAYLKPTLKAYGYKTSGQTWWKNMGDFFIVINLQNSQWNSKEQLSFCLNIGVALTEKLADKDKKKATYFDLATQVREDAYLTEERQQVKKSHGGWLGYKITDTTNLTEFIADFKIDLENNILKILDGFKTLSDCVTFYEKFSFWDENLKRQIEECGLRLN
ncbi:DUF4304 domain-containing protein [Flavobacterium sp. LC2016-23]|uniref:DUF4304 domain-containing protein n=1 Tax=Flavobacterium sp. LC2016-23 TaxID=2666330 RepID=UPI0012AFF443|nr:DUF4304 domain-containing protein [Flavobacterium sp. LC2016-23]MRX41556.1 DUF4304 domain-containing protein [Flavobacterium sp. LC2016-23]